MTADFETEAPDSEDDLGTENHPVMPKPHKVFESKDDRETPEMPLTQLSPDQLKQLRDAGKK